MVKKYPIHKDKLFYDFKKSIYSIEEFPSTPVCIILCKVFLILNSLYVSFYNICLFLYFRTLLNRLASEHANQCHEIELENEVLSRLIEELDKAE